MKRINLLRMVSSCIRRVKNQLEKANIGNVCAGVDKYIDDYFQCKSIPFGLWIDSLKYKRLIESLKMDGRYSKWVNLLRDMNNLHTVINFFF